MKPKCTHPHLTRAQAEAQARKTPHGVPVCCSACAWWHVMVRQDDRRLEDAR